MALLPVYLAGVFLAAGVGGWLGARVGIMTAEYILRRIRPGK
jgi:hypothetical protein